jgi:hypothetical protein
MKALFQETAALLKGSDRRQFMAKTVNELGRGGQSIAEQELGWNRGVIRKGKHELESGVTCVDAFEVRGRKSIESRLPNLLDDLKSLVDSQSQTDPQFSNNRLYTRLSAATVRRQLIEQKGYGEQELPSEETIRVRLNRLGYYPSKVGKTKPQKK